MITSNHPLPGRYRSQASTLVMMEQAQGACVGKKQEAEREYTTEHPP